MLIFTSAPAASPRRSCSHGKVAIAGVTMSQRFDLGRDDVCYVSMPLFHSNAVLVGWAVAAACEGSMALRRKFSASNFIVDVRRYGATYANYVGKPLSYVLATPERPTMRTTRCARSTATRACPTTSSASGADSGASCRTDSAPPKAAWPSRARPIRRRVHWARFPTASTSSTPTPARHARREWSANWSTPRAGPFRGLLQRRGGRGRTDGRRVYHSGDLAYRDDAGYAYFAGRLGDWMRVDGENLGAAPIERVLLRHPDITEVAVYPVPDAIVGDQVMAAVVMAPGTEFDDGSSAPSWPSSRTWAPNSGRRTYGSAPNSRGR